MLRWLYPTRRPRPAGDLLVENLYRSVDPAQRGYVYLYGWYCGTVSIPSWVPPPQGPRIHRDIVTRRLRIEGVVIFDHLSRFDAVVAELAAMLRSGTLKTREDIETDLARAPAALVDVYTGRNTGKKLIDLRDVGNTGWVDQSSELNARP